MWWVLASVTFETMASGSVFSGVTPGMLLTILSALGLLGGIGLGIKAILERRTLNATAKATSAKAGSEDANAASIVAAAARELIDPLRQELATERAENAVEVERERAKVRQLQEELDKATTDVAALRSTVRHLMEEVDDAQVKIIKLDQTILEKDREIVRLEKEIARYREARFLNDLDGLDFGKDTP
jgi:predicted RNase H-like nuclease (RuvC/YqgF family)